MPKKNTNTLPPKKPFDWDNFWEENRKRAAELRKLKNEEGRKHCRCCPAHPDYENLNHAPEE